MRAVGKVKQKIVPKITKPELMKEGESRALLDVATVKRAEDQPSVTKPSWRAMMDGQTGLKFSDFFETKNGAVEPTCKQLHKCRARRHKVTILRVDNAGESDWKFGVDCKFTARDVPRHDRAAQLKQDLLSAPIEEGRSL